nr:tyrosine-type recombinase/integrase [Vagococcus salmoninarum]
MLFHNKENNFLYVDCLTHLLETALKNKLTPHSFRHTHASLLFETRATIKEAQVPLGHSDIKTTMNVYAHVTKIASKKALNKLSLYANF